MILDVGRYETKEVASRPLTLRVRAHGVARACGTHKTCFHALAFLLMVHREPRGKCSRFVVAMVRGIYLSYPKPPLTTPAPPLSDFTTPRTGDDAGHVGLAEQEPQRLLGLTSAWNLSFSTGWRKKRTPVRPSLERGNHDAGRVSTSTQKSISLCGREKREVLCSARVLQRRVLLGGCGGGSCRCGGVYWERGDVSADVEEGLIW